MPEVQDLLKDVPQDIKYWFGSEKIMYLISAINQKLRLEGENQRIIPRLLLRLEVRNLLPQNFVSELSKELNKPLDELKPIIEEIKKNILLPIDSELFKWGVDIRQISAGYGSGGWGAVSQSNKQTPQIGQSPSLQSFTSPQTPIPMTKIEIIPSPPAITSIKPTTPPQDIPKPQPQPITNQNSDAPFMLYQKQEQKPVAESIKSRIVGEIEINAGGKPTANSVPARIEIGPEFPKVVHYSDFKTPVNNQGQMPLPPTPTTIKPETAPTATEEVLDLSAFKTQAKQNAQAQPQANGQPKVEGNTLDLR